MVLVDTSVWIRFLGNRPPYASQLDTLLDRDEVVGHEFVYGELLIGDRSIRTKLLESYEKLPQAGILPHREITDFVIAKNLHGIGIGWIDVHLLASSIVGRYRLWTTDQNLHAAARRFGIDFEESSLNT